MPPESKSDHQRLEAGLGSLLFVGLFFYVWKGVGPHLLYYGFGVFTAYPAFRLESSFLGTVFRTPGGPVDALAALLSQSYAYAWFGAAVITLVLGTLFCGVRRVLRQIQAEKFRDLAWLAPLPAVMIYNRYENPLSALLSVALPLWTTVLYTGLSGKAPAKRAGSFLVLFAMIYYLAGAPAFAFVIAACLIEARRRRQVILALVEAALAAAGALVVGRFILGQSLLSTCTAGTPWDPTGDALFSGPTRRLLFALYAFTPAVIVVLLLGDSLRRLFTRWRAHRPQENSQGTASSRTARCGSGLSPRIWRAARVLVLTVTMALVLTFSRTTLRYERAVNYHAQRRHWDAVVALARHWCSRAAVTRVAVFDINRALAHEGWLGNELCAYPQIGTKALFLGFDDMTGRLQHAKTFELYMDLGCLNDAEKNIYEILENDGPSPYVLEAMVRVHLAKGQYVNAQIAFRALRRCVGGRPYAHRWESAMADPAQAESNPLIQSYRAVSPTTDHASMGISAVTLKRLLQDHPQHRLAFEYLMAWYLLKQQRAEVVRCLPLLRPLGYTELPRHYAEALLVHSLETRTPVETWGWPIAPDLRLAFGEIRRVVTQGHGNNQAIFDSLVPKYGDTYTFYSMFNICGQK